MQLLDLRRLSWAKLKRDMVTMLGLLIMIIIVVVIIVTVTVNYKVM